MLRRCRFAGLLQVALCLGVTLAAAQNPAARVPARGSAVAVPAAALRPADLLKQARQIVFLGDSITADGKYVAGFESWLFARRAENQPSVLNLGLPSETVSGLSEAGHAGGKFPRPQLAERLERVLRLTRPDLVIACYGMNCGIYEPLDQDRFDRFQAGILQLKETVEKQGAKIVLVTPPCYDDQQAPLAFSYNEVLAAYSQWLVERRDMDGWRVIDLHTAMTKALATRRSADAKFTFQPDGVHPDGPGQWFIAQQLIGWFGDDKSAQAADHQELLKSLGVPPKVYGLVLKRGAMLHDSYLSTTRHLRPDMPAGLPLLEAERRASGELLAIQKLLSGG